MTDLPVFTAFAGHRLLARGALSEVALAVKAAEADGPAVLTFSDATGGVIDLDLRGSDAEIVARLAPPTGDGPAAPPAADVRARGRPKLGVVAREVTLLPRHWDWLATKRGGASQALRRLVDDARRAEQAGAGPRLAQERTYRFISALAGDLPGFEEVSRALFADDAARFAALVSAWPEAVAGHALRLAGIAGADSDHRPNG